MKSELNKKIKRRFHYLCGRREGLTFWRLSCILRVHVFIRFTGIPKASWSNAVMTKNLLVKCMVRKVKHSKLNERITRLLSAVFGNTSYNCPPGGGRDSAYERGGNARQKFWIKPPRPIWAWPKRFLSPKRDDKNIHIKYIFLYFFVCNPKRDLHG